MLKSAAVVCLIFSLRSSGLGQATSSIPESAGSDKDSVFRLVQQATKRGDTELRLPVPKIFPTGVDSVSTLLLDYSIIRFKVADVVTTPSGAGLRTWYKLQTLETISPQSQIDSNELPAGVPPQLLPLTSQQLLFPVTGGVATVDGVRVIQGFAEAGLELRRSQEYVGAFLLEYSGKLASAAAGSAGIFSVSGGVLKPQGDPSRNLVREIQDGYGSRLDNLRRDVRQRIGQPKQQ
jgi:hypothetical protein